LKVRESPSKGVWVDGLHEEFISSEDEIAELLNVGEAARTTSATDMNARSSRSHSVFMIIVEQKAADGSVKSGKLNLVDLAGSERVAKTNVNAKQLDEVLSGTNQKLNSTQG
jgi:kinesin family protein 5